jgi:hypothetical protein
MRGKTTQKSGQPGKRSPPRSRKAARSETPLQDQIEGEWPYDLPRRIVQVTGVPQALQSLARSSVYCAIHLVEGREWRRDDGRRKLEKAASYEQLACLSRELDEAIMKHLDQFGALSWSRDGDTEEEQLDPYDLMDLLSDFADDCELAPPSRKKAPHRPSGTVQSPELHFLIGELYKSIVVTGNGELTLWQDTAGDLKGTLPTVLTMLHDLLPDKVPANPSYTTLRRYLSEAASDTD